MSAPAFNPNDHTTWPTSLTVAEMAQIRRLSVARINRLASEGRFVPAPAPNPVKGLRPRRTWLKEDVLRVFVPSAAKGKR